MQIPKRIDTFELHEEPWMNDTLKALFREILSWEEDFIGAYSAATPILQQFLRTTKASGILDLCSGAGGPAVNLLNVLPENEAQNVRIKLSDLYPPVHIYEKLSQKYTGRLFYEKESFDATHSVRDTAFPVRTLLSAFHHFSPKLARKILIDAVRYSDGICIMDPFHRDLWHLAAVPMGTVAGCIAYPFIKNPTPLAFAACNLTPLMGSMFFWDGFASVLRGYTERELLDLVDIPECAAFRWETGTWSYPTSLPLGQLKGIYLVGYRT
ncbi:MAG: hypothetical protein LDLANPLL_00981 [Turneriella sp.]|nr:hypothetical protein [Turneriella sp.]